jgi:hypothetical protein
MKKYKEVLFVLLGFILGIVLIVGCGAKIDEDTTPAEEEIEESVIIEEEPEETPEQEQPEGEDCDAVRSELESLKAKYEALQTENSELTTRYNELSDDYDELTTAYNSLLTGAPDITESDVEQNIFDMINAKREENGLSELWWTDTFYEPAKEHSNYLADENVVEPSELSYMQGVFRAAGYSTLDRITNAASMVWEREQGFALNFLGIHAKYGTVAATKSGDIYYITFLADTHK